MELIALIIISIIFVILLGCIFLANLDAIGDYFSSTSIADYGKYKINLIDDTDIKYIKFFVPKDTLDTVAKKLLSDDKKIIFPNALITDQQLMGTNDRYMGNELPWDKEIGQCDVLRDMDIDLYKNVQDSKKITFW